MARGFFIRLRSYKRDWHLRQFPLVPMCQFSQLHALPGRNQTRVQLKTATSASRFANDTKGGRVSTLTGSADCPETALLLFGTPLPTQASQAFSMHTRGQGTRNPSRLLFPWPPLRSCLRTFAFVLYSPLSTTPHRIHSLRSCLAS